MGRIIRDAGRGYAALPLLIALVALVLDRVGARIDSLALLSVVVACTLASVAGWWLGRRLERSVAGPLCELAETARRLDHGDLSARAEPGGGHEITVVGRGLNTLASDLEGLADGLGELDEMKSSFMSTVSHELRTPLTSIRGYVELLAEEETGPLNEEQREFVEIITRNARRLETLIADLLTLSRLESGAVRLDRSPLDYAPLVCEVAGELRDEAVQRGIEMDLASSGAAIVLGDAPQLARALANVISNAIGFSPPGSSVRVSCGVFGSDVVTEVVDSGPGISAEELPNVTHRFFRGTAARSTQGTGLGLTIAREVVDRHGGKLEIESEEGAGSTVRVRLPAYLEAERPEGGRGGASRALDGRVGAHR